MASTYILTFTVPKRRKPSGAPVIRPARLGNGAKGPAGRLTVVNGNRAVSAALAEGHRKAIAAGRDIYRVDLYPDLKPQPRAKPSLDNLAQFTRLDLSLATTNLRRHIVTVTGQDPDEWASSADKFLEFMSEPRIVGPEAVNLLWDTVPGFDHIKVFSWPLRRHNLASRRAVFQSGAIVEELRIPGYPIDWPLPEFDF